MGKLILGIVIGAIFDDYVVAFCYWSLNQLTQLMAG